MNKVLVFGVFDILHPGHLYFLEQAKKQGNCLIVVITRDQRVLVEKKHQPLLNETERCKMIKALKVVDQVVLGDKVGEWKILNHLKPDIVCVGYDQNAEGIKRCALKKLPKIIKIKKHKNYNSTHIRSIRS